MANGGGGALAVAVRSGGGAGLVVAVRSGEWQWRLITMAANCGSWAAAVRSNWRWRRQLIAMAANRDGGEWRWRRIGSGSKKRRMAVKGGDIG